MSKKLNKKKAPLKLVEAVSTKPIKLDLGCGQNPKEGFEGVDLYGDKATHKVDLFKFPWPFKDNSISEIHASHLLEHVPAREVEFRDLIGGDGADDSYFEPTSMAAKRVGADMLFAFMDECWRIMKPDTWMTVIVPSGRSNRAFWDPTHRRFFMQETFLYFARAWRKQNGLDHYRVTCNFGLDVTHSMPNEEGLRSQDVQTERFKTLWNVTVDWMARLTKQA